MAAAAHDLTRRRVARVPALVIDGSGRRRRTERLVGEEPLEIRVAVPGGEIVGTTATMRTPGADFALAAGLLLAEGVVAEVGDILTIRYCADVREQRYNVVTVDLRREPRQALAARTIGSTASCGVCGTASIDELMARLSPVRGGARAGGEPPEPFDPAVLVALPDRLRAAQPVFDETGGLHAAGLFDRNGRALAVHEDVGRHNALDKVLGERFLAGDLPAPDHIVVLSGRVSFELVQKAAVAGAPVICAVSAPSSLAVATAERLGVTLAGFVRGGRMTVYTHAERLAT